MHIIEPVSSTDLQQYYALRWQVLRAPWNQPPGSERDTLDEHSTHVMIVDDSHRASAVGRLHFNSIREAQIRYMAVAPRCQRQGLGSRLLKELESRAVRHGASHIVLDARETALRFYLRHGYTTTGPGHTLFNSIAHVRMCKELTDVQTLNPAAHTR